MAYITGASMINIDRHYDKSIRRLASDAVFKLDSSSVENVDYVIVASSISYLQEPQLDLASYIASALGLRNARAFNVEAGEVSGATAVLMAKSLVDSRLASKVLVVGVDKLSNYPSAVTYKHISLLNDSESESLYSIGLGGIAGILMRLYMETYKVDRLTLAYWPALMHSNAKLNPYAMLRFTITPEKVLDAMPIADPITLLDTFPIGDGAAALVVESKPRDALAEIVAVESAVGYPSITLSPDPLRIDSLELAYSRLTEKLDLKRIDVIELHDSYTISAILQLESLRLAERGKAAEAVANGYFTVNGDGPVVNPSGGLKARGHPIGATSVYQVAEVASQIAGIFPGLKVPDAKSGLVVSVNGFGSNSYVVYLRGVE
ncbi:MAG: thiolase family protein [Acidilobaceae archaeon]